MYRIIITGLSLVALTAPAAAQDVFMPGTSPMDLAPQSQALTSSVIGNLSVGETARRGGGGGGGISGIGRVATGAGAGGALAFAPGGQVSDARMPFATSSASQKQALGEYLDRVRAKNPQAAAEGAKAFAGVNLHQRFVDAARPLGLKADDAADVMTAFLLGGWEIMNGREPTNAEIRGVRRQVAGQLASTPQMRDQATRTKFGEELKIQFVVLGSGYMSAQKEGNVAQYRQGVSRLYQRITGRNIGAWGLSPAGFTRS